MPTGLAREEFTYSLILRDYSCEGNARGLFSSLRTMSAHNHPEVDSPTAHLVLVEQSGTKHDIPQPSTVEAMIEAEHAMHRASCLLRQIKVVSQHTAVARWKAGELGWRRVA